MEHNLIQGNSLDVVYSQRSGYVYQTIEKKAVKPLKVDPMKSHEDSYIVPWGVNNNFPQKVLKEIRKNTIIGPTLKKQAEIAYDQIVYGTEEPAEEGGEPKFRRIYDPKVEAFFKRSRIHRYGIEALRNFYFFYFTVPRIIFTADRSEVYSLSCYKTAHFRFGKPDKQGFIRNGYVSASWEDRPSMSGEYVERIPLIDIYADPEMYKEEGTDFKYIYPIAYPTEDEINYPLVDWNAARESGWLDVAQSIPIFKKNLMKNQINLKYLIQVPSWWWDWKYPGFSKMDEAKRRNIMDLEVDRFESFTKGEASAGSSMMVSFISDPAHNKEYQGWKIEAIDDKIKDGMYIEDSNEASSHLLYSLGMDPAIIGSQPGSKLGAGSGSDKRVAFNIYVDTVKAHQDLILEPLSWIAEYNGWPPYTFKFANALTSEEAAPSQPSKSPLNEPQQQAD
ncbi:hypothetical protein DN752_21105 [Echinicola strongylocentroti]|uniref:Phage portal protein n=1 Tax=Echinicola strongylocentroti TaxID=1795355 RepID=A0A2Z4IMW1_9BACT|nr:hypothetical protein [Echinicola strongylocentroti]AWW32442.1 hypothetical protein DN752_21105 [Echinicola strongylocentroti]